MEIIEKEFAERWYALKKELPAIKKTSVNSYIGNKYASLEEIMKALHPLLEKYGMSLHHTHRDGTLGVYLVTRILAKEYSTTLFSEYFLGNESDPQKMASRNSYARRYNICNLFDIVTEDDDGNEASGKVENVVEKPYKSSSEEIKSRPFPGHDNVGKSEDGSFISRFVPKWAGEKKLTSKAGKKLTKYSVKDQEGNFYSSLDHEHGKYFYAAYNSKVPLVLNWVKSGDFRNATNVTIDGVKDQHELPGITVEQDAKETEPKETIEEVPF